MRNFLLRGTLFSIGFAVIVGAAVWWLPNTGVSNSMYAAVIDKHAMLERTQSPRILLVGGSNVSFGVDSE